METGSNLSQGCLVVAAGDAYRLFDKETNQHDEQLLRSQLAANHLRVLVREASDEALGIIDAWLMKLFSLFKEILGLMERTKNSISLGSNVWFGDLTYSPDVFIPLYQISLGFWAVQGSQDIAAKFSDNFSLTLQLAAAQSQNPHPILTCLWNELSGGHQPNVPDTNPSWFKGSTEGFDPCFLRTL